MQLKEYQKQAIEDTWEGVVFRGGHGLWLNMGLGKTAVVLHACEIMKVAREITKILVVAPSRVVTTWGWPNEVEKWGMDFKVVTIDSNAKNRKHPFMHRESNGEGDVYVISCDSLSWLLKRKDRPEFDFLVVDESTKFKNWSAYRTKALRKLLTSIERRVTLTGTPVPNNLVEIFPQQFILDSGKTLGSKITNFRNHWCQPCGFELREWEVRPHMEPVLKDLIAPWYTYQSAMDHLDLPEKVENIVPVQLSDSVWKTYKQMEKEMFTEISEKGVVALTGSSRYTLLRQITGGAVYTEEGVEEIHQAKLDTLSDLLDEINRPAMVAYTFRHEMDRLRKRFPKIRAINGDTSGKESREILRLWKQKKIPLLAVQPQALSHGVDGLQHGGNDLIWYTITDRPEDKSQLEGRLHRQGVKGEVVIHYLIVDRTVDSAIKATLEKKGSKQNDLLNAIRDQADRRTAESR
jgi:SNF2 family DNA or RNA helicase